MLLQLSKVSEQHQNGSNKMSDLQLLRRRAMRSSLDAIPIRPPPTLQQLSSNKSNCKMMKTKTKEPKAEETEVVNDSICNSFRFVVNYG